MAGHAVDFETFEDLVAKVAEGDDDATAALWNRYYASLVRVAAGRLPRGLKRTADEEDVALSAFQSFVDGVRGNRFPDLSTPDNLWGLLMTLTARKVHAHVRRQTRQKRGGGSVRGESVFVEPGGEVGAGINAASGAAEPPDLIAELNEATEELLAVLDDEELRKIAVMRMDGYMVDEIATYLTRSKRAIERRLALIRKIWSEMDDEPTD